MDTFATSKEKYGPAMEMSDPGEAAVYCGWWVTTQD